MIPAALMLLIRAGVDAMATPTYNFAYGLPDVVPVVDSGAPLVYLETPDEAGLPAENHPVGRYSIDSPLTFRVLVPRPGAGVTIDDQVMKVVSDFKLLMHSLHDSLKAAGGFQYSDFVSASKAYRLVAAYPAQVTVNFNIRYRQSKSAPGG